MQHVDCYAKSLQSCPTLCDPIDGSPPGFPIPEILQTRTVEWVAISFFNAWKWKVKVKSLSHVQLLATTWTAAYQAPPSMGFSRQEYWSGVPLPSPQPIAAAAKSLQLCPTLCDPIDGSPSGSPIPGILQARVLEWGVIAFSETIAKWHQIILLWSQCYLIWWLDKFNKIILKSNLSDITTTTWNSVQHGSSRTQWHCEITRDSLWPLICFTSNN